MLMDYKQCFDFTEDATSAHIIATQKRNYNNFIADFFRHIPADRLEKSFAMLLSDCK